jgi:ketosteroid isomerase-like protein
MPLQFKGIRQYQKTWELFFDHMPGGPGSFNVTELRVIAGESVAYCHALVKVSDAKVRLTLGLRKVRGQWRIAHEHHSYPVELNSGS